MLFLEKLEQKKVYIVISFIVCIILSSFFAKFFLSKEYVSESTIMLIDVENKENNGTIELTDSLTATLSEVIKSENITNSLESKYNIDLSNKITLNKIDKSDTFKIGVKDYDSIKSIEINNDLYNEFSENIKKIYKDVDTYRVDSAKITYSIYGMNLVYIYLGTVLAWIICIALYIGLLIQKDKIIRKTQDIESDLSLKELIKIPMKSKSKRITSELISFESEKTITSKAFKKLRSNIQFLNVNNKDKNIMLITSPNKQDGKSYIAANIAVSFAEVGKKVILIDANMLSGRQGQIFNIPNNLGFSNYLSGLDTNGIEINELINKYINETAIKNLNLITSGTVPPNPSELLTSGKLNEMIKDLTVFYDVIVIDTPSVLNSTDSLILTRYATSTILVIQDKKTKKDDLYKSKRDIQNVGGKIIGVVVNKVKQKEKKNIKADFIKLRKSIKEKIERIIIKVKDRIYTSKEQKLLDTAKEMFNQENKVKDTPIMVDHENEVVVEVKKDEKEVKLEEVEKVNLFENIATGVKGKISNFVKVKDESKEKEDSKIDEENKIEKVKEINVIEKEDETIHIIEPFIEEAVNSNIRSGSYFSIDTLNNIKNTIVRIFNYIKEFIIEVFNEIVKFAICIKDFVVKYSKIIIEKIKSLIEKIKDKIKKIKEERAKRAVDNAKKVSEEIANNFSIENKEKEVKQNLDKIKVNKEDKKDKEIVQEKETKTKEEKNNISDKNVNTNNVKDDNKTKKIIDDFEISKEEKEEQYYEISEDGVLVIVDAEYGYCRAFSKFSFTEKLVRGIDRIDGFMKAFYSTSHINETERQLYDYYDIEKHQLKRIDPLIYKTLIAYDECVWLEKKIVSHKAENYALVMASEYERLEDETNKEYELRSKRLRKAELIKNDIDIEYKLDNLLKSKLNLFDKIAMKKYAKFYEISPKEQSYIEKKNSEENKKIYINISNVLAKFKNKEIEENENIKENNQIPNQMNFEDYSNYNDEINRQEELKRQKEEEKKQKEELKIKKEQEKRERRLENKARREIQRKERARKQEELKRLREEAKNKQKEEARIEEELLEDNLYPKTKYNKNI